MSDETGYEAAARGRAMIEMGRYEEAQETLSQAVASLPEDPEVRCQLALSQLRSGNQGPAVKTAESASALAPDWEWPHRLRALALAGSKRPDEALAAAQEAVRLQPDLSEAHYVEAQVRYLRKDLPEAREAAKRAVSINPEFAATHSLLGDISEAEDRPTEAASHYRRALAIDPEDAETHNNYGVTLLRLDREEEAHREFETAARLDPRLDLPRQNLGAATRSSVNGWVGFLIGSWLAIQTVRRFAEGNTEAGAGFAVALAFVIAIWAYMVRDRTRKLSPATQAVLADQKWHEKLEIRSWRPWFYFIPSPIWFVGGAIVLTVLVYGGVEGGDWDGNRIPAIGLFTLFVGYMAWRGHRYLRYRGWWPGTG